MLSTTDALTATGLTAADDDVATFHPTSLGGTTTGTWDPVLRFDGAVHALDPNDVTGVDLP